MKVFIIFSEVWQFNTTPDCSFCAFISWIDSTVIHIKDVHIGMVSEIPLITIPLYIRIYKPYIRRQKTTLSGEMYMQVSAVYCYTWSKQHGLHGVKDKEHSLLECDWQIGTTVSQKLVHGVCTWNSQLVWNVGIAYQTTWYNNPEFMLSLSGWTPKYTYFHFYINTQYTCAMNSINTWIFISEQRIYAKR